MALDPALAGALKAAAKEAGQPDAVANRLLAWLTNMSDSELSRDARGQFYDDVRQAVLLPGADDAD
ncbi:hypothetical protein M3P36_03355 [Altererythrobacter sp. KTW20L]|jgi:hypothetical protein|uniref:CxC ATPase DNA modification system associated small protein n=1 Tax=Altererythrobacter sp. KTW20L TaxID=2942210 RepID=UPI0020C0376A|nr:CxC ATPase DNA modification system associated small protein [Altererythrobacter sp. KTW20L]MCL6250088.1 hypothetical protein [Altererythrobacter sp. KTW20L]